MTGSSNGAGATGGWDFPFPAWVLVSESDLWKLGIAESIAFYQNKDVCNGEHVLVFFAGYADAMAFRGEQTLDMRPLALDEPVVLVGIVNYCIRQGVNHVAYYTPDQPGKPLLAGSARELSDRLSDILRAQNG